MSSDDRHLTTTGYAMLGLLATRPWSTYELTKQMRRSLHHVWPRAESNVYAEAKRLVAAGLVTTETRRTGKRARTIYTITPAGLAALRRWLGRSGRLSEYAIESRLSTRLRSPSLSWPSPSRCSSMAVWS